MFVSVAILNFSRPEYIRNSIIPFLDKVELVNEILISHGKKEAVFSTPSIKVKHLYHYGEPNDTYGLTLRFLTASQASNEHVIIMDDDIIPDSETIKNLHDAIIEDERIHGLYGRDLDENNGYYIDNVFGEVPIVLTRCLITTRSMCNYFLEHFRSYESERIKKSKPYWNGEDILFSLLSVEKYKKLPVAHDLRHTNRVMNYLNLSEAISFGSDHSDYRRDLTKELLGKIDIHDQIKAKNITKRRTQFGYFFDNSDLVYIIISILAVSLIIYYAY